MQQRRKTQVQICEAHLARAGTEVPAYRMGLCRSCYSGRPILEREVEKGPRRRARKLVSQRFRDWVFAYKVRRLAKRLGSNRATVYGWVHPARPTPPKLREAQRLIRLSKVEPLGIGRLDWTDVYGDP